MATKNIPFKDIGWDFRASNLCKHFTKGELRYAEEVLIRVSEEKGGWNNSVGGRVLTLGGSPWESRLGYNGAFHNILRAAALKEELRKLENSSRGS